MRAAAALVAALAASLILHGSLGAAAREVRGAPPGDFDLYLLALSWSPGFCASGGTRRDPVQCRAGNPAGLVVHGLWPQYERGFPTFCRSSASGPQARDLEPVIGLMPSTELARYQWRKHGTCSGLPPSRYFQAVAAARRLLAVPPELEDGTGGSVRSPIGIERALAAANPGLRPDMTAVDCGRSDDGAVVLQEVRVCLTRDLRRFRPCPADVEQRTCRSPNVVIIEAR